jgi:hypothetical protein
VNSLFGRVILLFCVCFGSAEAAVKPLFDVGPAEGRTDQLFENYGESAIALQRGNGTLSAFWAQRMQGNDLIADDVFGNEVNLNLDEKWELDFSTDAVDVAVVDFGFYPEAFTGKFSPAAARPFLKEGEFDNREERVGGGHGSGVVNLINGRLPVGMSFGAQISQLLRATDIDGLRRASEALEMLPPMLVNVPESVSDQQDAVASLKKIGERHFMITSAGNEYPAPPNPTKRAVRAIVVGSAGHSGFATATSQEVFPETNAIWAPADFHIRTIKSGEKRYEPFAETSAAAALVTGASANLFSVLRTLEFGTLFSVLRNSAFKTINASDPRHRNGVGLLNAYKAFRVAVRLRYLGWPKVEVALDDPNAKIYDFQNISRRFFTEGERLLREKGRKQAGFNYIRRALLLDATNEPARRKHIEIYQGEGLSGNAEFYVGLNPDDQFQLILSRLQDLVFWDETYLRSVVRTAGMLPRARAIEALKIGVVHTSMSVRADAVLALRSLGIDAVPLLVSAMQDDSKRMADAICWTTLQLEREGIPLEGLGTKGVDYLEAHYRQVDFEFQEFRNAEQMVKGLRTRVTRKDR